MCCLLSYKHKACWYRARVHTGCVWYSLLSYFAVQKMPHCSFKASGTTGTAAHSRPPPRISPEIKRLKPLYFPCSQKRVLLMSGLLPQSLGQKKRLQWQFEWVTMLFQCLGLRRRRLCVLVYFFSFSFPTLHLSHYNAVNNTKQNGISVQALDLKGVRLDMKALEILIVLHCQVLPSSFDSVIWAV